jgi:hypothetical protein
MDRIKLRDWTQQTHDEKLEKLLSIRALRASEKEASRLKRGGLTKSATRNLAKRGKDPTKAAKTALGKLTPEQIAAIASKLNL